MFYRREKLSIKHLSKISKSSRNNAMSSTQFSSKKNRNTRHSKMF